MGAKASLETLSNPLGMSFSFYHHLGNDFSRADFGVEHSTALAQLLEHHLRLDHVNSPQKISAVIEQDFGHAGARTWYLR